MGNERLSVLFLCTGNSARSQMAEALLRQILRDKVEVFSAGSHPRPVIHPMAREVMGSLVRLDLAGQYPKLLDEFVGQRFDYVISVCDKAAEICPIFPGDPERIRWSFEDPSAVEGTEEEKRRAFERTARDLMGRIRIWLSLPAVSARAGATSVGHAV